MKRRLMALALLAMASYAHAEDIRPGLWKITLESSVAATPDWKPQPYEISQCLTEADAQNPERLLAGMGTSGATGCDFQNRQDSGSSLKFDLACGGTLGIKGHGEITYSSTSLDGVLDVTMGDAQTVSMQNKIHASYLGDCQNK